MTAVLHGSLPALPGNRETAAGSAPCFQS